MSSVAVRRTGSWLVALALVSACTTVPRPGGPPAARPETGTQAREPARINLSGFPQAFREGHADGCDSARTGSRRRDEGRYKGGSDYMMGWNDGYSICARR